MHGPGECPGSVAARYRVRALIACAAPISGLEASAAEARDVRAIEAEPTATELARQDQNPITRFCVMRFENNVQLGFGPDDEPVDFFRFQPLVPIGLGAEWTLLTRLVVPVVHLPWPETKDGLGDVSMIAFLTPARSSRFVWGIGPAMLLPTATREILGTGKFPIGPGVAGAYTGERWGGSVSSPRISGR